MKKLETVIHIHSPLRHVWNVLIDFDRYAEWNPFVKKISGEAVEGKKISVTVQLPRKKAMVFKPIILKSVKESEFRWRGKFIVRGIFDGEHYFILSELPNGSTALKHGEIFNGILLPFMGRLLKNTKSSFENMNVALKEWCEKSGPAL